MNTVKKGGNVKNQGDSVHRHNNHYSHGPARHKSKFGQHMADAIAKIGGSWPFVIGFLAFIFLWVLLNGYLLFFKPWDPFPFIFLNLVLSCVAALQAPVILMSQNRQHEREVAKAERDYYINRKAEREIKILQRDMVELKAIVKKQPLKDETDALNAEIKKINEELKILAGLYK